MEFRLEEFEEAPSLEKFDKCNKEHLMLLAGHYEVVVSKQAKKKELKALVWEALVNQGVLPGAPVSPRLPVGPEQSLGEAVKMREIELEFQKLAVREREGDLHFQLNMKRLEFEEETKRAEFRLREKELDFSKSPAAEKHQEFDVSRNIRLVPPFIEKDIETYFTMFERVATSVKWPKSVWTLLLQCVLVGKARDIYASLSIDDSLDYEMVKETILRAYELVPEAYRQKFRRFRKYDKQTYVEFAREKEALFGRWCTSQRVHNFAELRSLMIMEEFKNCVPDSIAMYLNEQKVTDVSRAAVLADEFVLTHKFVFEEPRFTGFRGRPVDRGYHTAAGSEEYFHYSPVPREGNITQNRRIIKTDRPYEYVENEGPICFYCKRSGHIVANCDKLKREDPKPVVLVNRQQTLGGSVTTEEDDRNGFSPFIMKGFVSMGDGDEKVPVNILRDTASSQTFILEDVLQLSDKTAVGSNVPVVGFGMEDIGVPLHKVKLESELVSGQVAVGIRSRFPVKGVSVILGNDLAGGKVLITPEVTPVMMSQCSVSLGREKTPSLREQLKERNQHVARVQDMLSSEREKSTRLQLRCNQQEAELRRREQQRSQLTGRDREKGPSIEVLNHPPVDKEQVELKKKQRISEEGRITKKLRKRTNGHTKRRKKKRAAAQSCSVAS